MFLQIDSNPNSRSQLKYNFVFYGVCYDYLRPIIGEELYHSDYVHIYNEFFEDNKFLRKLHHYHWAYTINKIINLPFKKLWFHKMYNQHFKHDLPICFVYVGGHIMRYDRGYLEFVRKMDPRNRQVILYEDKVPRKNLQETTDLHKRFDLAVTYNEDDARQFGIYYYKQDCYSKLIPEPESTEFYWDAYLLASAKDRLPKIMSVYHRLHYQGVNCKFLLAGVPKQLQEPLPGIEYITSISYIENLKNVIHSKCILEITQGKVKNTTLRAKEAISYRRRLLTDCQSVDPKQFNPGQLQLFQSPELIDCDFLKAPINPDHYPQLVDLDPMQRLYDLQNQLDLLQK